MIKTNSTAARQTIFKPTASTSATLSVFHACFLWFFFFFVAALFRLGVYWNCMSQYMLRGAEKTRALSVGQVLLWVFAENRIMCQWVLTYCTHTQTHTHACFAFPAGIIKEERWVGLSLFLYCMEMLVLVCYGDKADWRVIFPCLF